MSVRAPAAVAVASALTLAGCGTTGSDQDGGSGPSVLAASYPFAYVAERVAGPDAQVENLTPPGAEPHDLELSPQQVGDVAQADLVIIERGFQPAVEEAVEQNATGETLDVTDVVSLREADDDEHTGEGDTHGGHGSGGEGDTHEGHDHGDLDPHVWLDPTRLAEITTATGERLAEADPDHAAGYRKRAEALVSDLETLDRDFRQGLAKCERDVVVTGHDAFGYLTDRYGLHQVPVNGLEPDSDPSPARVAEVSDVVESEDVTTVFFETLTSPETSKSLARDAGVETAVLDPLEGLTEDSSGDYLSVMRDNLTALRTALGCR
jgi:zinc transport system substrate-binding protein